LYKNFERHKIKNYSDMFRIVCDPSSGSIELDLTEIRSGSLTFVVCLIGVWQRNFEPVVCVYGTTGRRPVLPWLNPTRFDLIYSCLDGYPKLLVTMYCNLITSRILISAPPTLFSRGTLLASKNIHGISHPCWLKYRVSGWQVSKITNL